MLLAGLPEVVVRQTEAVLVAEAPVAALSPPSLAPQLPAGRHPLDRAGELVRRSPPEVRLE